MNGAATAEREAPHDTGGAPAALLSLVGTHRVRPPEETIEWVRSVFPRMGITRLADLTHLDVVGIPVYQAIRPNGKVLSVSQGKGLSPALAKASAAMEAIELWHAENMDLEVTHAAIGEMERGLPYRASDLCLEPRAFLHPARRVEWVAGKVLADGARTHVPASYVALDAVPSGVWHPPLFEATSNGLASGNTYEEAVLHGLYEVLERDAVDRADLDARGAELAVNLDTIDGPGSAWLVERLRAAELDVQVFDATGATCVPTFSARIWSEAIPLQFAGHGCHLDKEVAMCRALTEAAQSRLTVIAGSRDDVSPSLYAHCAYLEDRLAVQRVRPVGDAACADAVERRSYADVTSLASLDLTRDLSTVIELITRHSGFSPIAVDLTKPELGVPVVRVVAPGMRRYPEV